MNEFLIALLYWISTFALFVLFVLCMIHDSTVLSFFFNIRGRLRRLRVSVFPIPSTPSSPTADGSESNESQQSEEHAVPPRHDPLPLADHQTGQQADHPALSIERDTATTLNPSASGESAQTEIPELQEGGYKSVTSREEHFARGKDQTPPRSDMSAAAEIEIELPTTSLEIQRKFKDDAEMVDEDKGVPNVEIYGSEQETITTPDPSSKQEDMATPVTKSPPESPCTSEGSQSLAREQPDTNIDSADDQLQRDVFHEHNAPTLSAPEVQPPIARLQTEHFHEDDEMA